MTPEKAVQNAIVDYLKSEAKKGKPIYVERRQAGGFSYKMGIPDLYAVYNGQHIEIEVKAPGKSLRPMQEKWRDKCKMLNIKYVCADNIDDIKLLFAELSDVNQTQRE